MKSASKTFEQLVFIVPSYYLCGLIDGDYSGLTDLEELEIENFTKDVLENHATARFSLMDDVGFKHKNDINNLGGDCTEIGLLVEIKN